MTDEPTIGADHLLQHVAGMAIANHGKIVPPHEALDRLSDALEEFDGSVDGWAVISSICLEGLARSISYGKGLNIDLDTASNIAVQSILINSARA